MNAIKSQPLFLPSADRQIFVMHYSPDDTLRQEVIIICPPAPQEIMRSQASLGQLARRLQEDGFHVVRFDYSGTGDSEGNADSISLDQWHQDVLSIAGWAKFHLRYQKLSLIGLRLGASMAIRASQHLDIDRLVLWDPVIDGLNYLYAMERSHKKMFELNVIEAPFASSRYSPEQCWGFPWTEAWRSELASISQSTLQPKARTIDIILSATDPLVRDTCTLWQGRGISVELQNVGEPLFWGDERFVKIRAFPAAHLRRIQALWEAQHDG